MRLNTILSKLKKPRYWVSFIVLAVIILIIVTPGKGPSFESEVAQYSEVSEIITGTGFVSASDEVSLSFEASGTIASVNIKEGDGVVRGQVLASLESGILQDEARSALAALSSQEARLQEMYAGLSFSEEAVAAEKLKTARLSLLTSDINAYFNGNQIEGGVSSYEPPTITGTYTGDEEGRYIINLYKSFSQSGYSFSLSGLENGTGEVSAESPKLLGTKGLHIQFPENFAKGSNTEWVVEIPNTRSSGYTARKQAYEQALADYNLSKEGTRPEQIKSQEALVDQARANYQRALNSLSRATLRSPITGVVRSVPVVGESVSPSQSVFFILSDGEYFVTLYVPESDIANISVGNGADVDFIAFPNEEFKAEIGYISPAAEIRDGITVFKTRLYFDEADSRIRAGMTADVDIFSKTIENTIAIPGRAVSRDNDGSFVRVMENGEIIERRVETGLRGYDGRVEIKSGLEEGDEVITFMN